MSISHLARYSYRHTPSEVIFFVLRSVPLIDMWDYKWVCLVCLVVWGYYVAAPWGPPSSKVHCDPLYTDHGMLSQVVLTEVREDHDVLDFALTCKDDRVHVIKHPFSMIGFHSCPTALSAVQRHQFEAWVERKCSPDQAGMESKFLAKVELDPESKLPQVLPHAVTDLVTQSDQRHAYSVPFEEIQPNDPSLLLTLHSDSLYVYEPVSRILGRLNERANRDVSFYNRLLPQSVLLSSEVVSKNGRSTRVSVRGFKDQYIFVFLHLDDGQEAPVANLPDEAECAICMEFINAQNAAPLRCGHWYHAACIDAWLLKERSCPYCRRTAPFPPNV